MGERFNELDRYEREPKPSALQELNTLRESFGFVEDTELAELHHVLLLATGPEHTELRKQLTGMYQDRVQEVIKDDPQPDKWHGAAIALAAIKLEAHRTSACFDDLQDIHYILGQDPRFEDEATRLGAVMNRSEFLNEY